MRAPSPPASRVREPRPGPAPTVAPPRSAAVPPRASVGPPAARRPPVAIGPPPPEAPPAHPGFHGAVTDFKRRLIETTLTQLGGNRTRTARALGLQRTYLLRLMREFEIHVPAAARPPGRGRASIATALDAPPRR